MSIIHTLKDLGRVSIQQIDTLKSSSTGIAHGNLEVCVSLPENRLFLAVSPDFEYFLEPHIRVRQISRAVYDLPSQSSSTVLKLTFIDATSTVLASFENTVSQRAVLEFTHNDSQAGRLSKLFDKSKVLIKGLSQKFNKAMINTTYFLEDKINNRVPGFLVISPQRCELDGTTELKEVKLMIGIGKQSQEVLSVSCEHNISTFNKQIVIKRIAEYRVSFEVWVEEAEERYHGSAVLEIDELVQNPHFESGLSIFKDRRVGVLYLRVQFIPEISVAKID